MQRAPWYLLLIAALLVIGPQFLVPLVESPGTLHAPVAVSLERPTTWPYAFGALVCHQRPDRSFTIQENQLPVCERCLAVELGMALVFGAAVVILPPFGFFASLGPFLPRRLRGRAGALAVGLVLMLPMVLDGGLQLMTPYVSTTPVRVITGLLYGIGQGGLVIASVAWLGAVLRRWRRQTNANGSFLRNADEPER